MQKAINIQHWRWGGVINGISFGNALAIAISWTTNESILWAILHGFFGWFYVLYYALFN